jgi:N-acetylglucosaminyldiphosphoundecaprenol N-acetyl-beta-D-mannosaminyltransferase
MAQTTDRAEVLGCAIDRLDMDQTLARCEQLIADKAFAQHVAINAAKLVAIRNDKGLREIVEDCELVSADGQAVVWASRLLGDPLPTRVAGIDLMHGLLARAEEVGYRVFILGARPEVLDEAVRRVKEEHPALNLVGARHGYFSDEEDEAVAAEVAAARPDILFVAMSSPRKEYWLGRYGRRIGVPFVMGVGGSVDVLAGITRRAPRPLQRLGLEWLYRLMQEPRRLVGRYWTTNARFIWMLLLAALRRRRRSNRGP